MFESNQNNNVGGYYQNPQAAQVQTKQPSVLTKEEFDRLNKHANQFTLTLSEDEYLRGICNHRTPDGSADTLVQQPDGSFRCTTCGWTFNPVDASTSEDEIQAAVDTVADILQTIKLLYIDMPVPVQREYFQIIPLLEKVPELFKIAVDDFAKYENMNGWAYRNGNMNAMSLFNMLTSTLNSNQPYGYQYQQPYYDPNAAQYQQPYGYQQPMYQQAPQQTVNPNQPVGATPPMSNGFGYPNGMPQQPYQPQQTGYQYSPQPYQPAAAPEQPGVQNPTDSTSETDGKTVSTQATFKA